MRRTHALLLSAASLTLLVAPPALAAPEGKLTDRSAKKLQRYVEPTTAEGGWETIPWRETLADGRRDAIERDRPILLWTMNGHPLGHT